MHLLLLLLCRVQHISRLEFPASPASVAADLGGTAPRDALALLGRALRTLWTVLQILYKSAGTRWPDLSEFRCCLAGSLKAGAALRAETWGMESTVELRPPPNLQKTELSSRRGGSCSHNS